MFTVCPKCALTLVVTAADLRVAQGYVRCGRCSSVFNALARLSDERQAAGLAEPPAPAPAADHTTIPQAAEPEEPAAAPEPQVAAGAAAGEPSAEHAAPEPEAEVVLSDDSLEFDPSTTDVNSVFVQPPPDRQWTAATGSFKTRVAANQEAARGERVDAQVDVEIDAVFLASMLRSEPPPPPRAPDPDPETDAEAADAPAAVPPRAHAPAQGRAARTPAPAHRQAGRAAPLARPAAGAAAAPAPRARVPALDEDPELALAGDDEHVEREDEDHASVGERVRAGLRGHAWPIGVALASLVLAMQVVNHYREELAATARFNRPITALYSALGVRLFPHWDLRAYDVRQLGASGEPGAAGLITVRASIKNAAPQPQPLPLLRVTLQDRFGNRIAARDVAPQFYLPRAIPASSFLSAGQRIDAQMGFADPGPNAVGFEIDACLPARGDAIACANDVTLR